MTGRADLVVTVLAIFLQSCHALGREFTSDVQNSDFTKGEECLRKCDGKAKNCYFSFVIERYATVGGACGNCTNGVYEDCLRPQCITADGYERPIISVNRQTPGPPIQVCRGDRLIVDVVNHMPDETTAVHWHGIHQNGSQYYDGVPYVTQCPILPGATFRYDFVVTNAGTYFYHSHIAVQKLDGLVGALIVREIEQEDPLSPLYNEDLPEHTILIQDWMRTPGEQLIPGLSSGKIIQSPDAYLINGRGMYYARNSSMSVPLPEFTIEKGKRYRFRLIGATSLTCIVAVMFQGHRLLAISADGDLRFKPVVADTVFLNSGERFDVVLEANQTEGLYLIHLQGFGNMCNPQPHVGVLVYNSVKYKEGDIQLPKPLDFDELGVMLNALTTTCNKNNSNELCVYQLEGSEDAVEHISSGKPYQQLEISFQPYVYDDVDLFKIGSYHRYDEPNDGLRFLGLINNVSFLSPPSPLISQFDDVPKDLFCTEECYERTEKIPCTCVNMYSIPFGTVVDLIIYDEGFNQFYHPFHFHGYNFYLLETGVLKEDEDKRMKLDSLKKRLKEDDFELKSAPMKDTISIPIRGYVLARFVANIPGFWMFHCHYAYHLEAGMAAILKIGDESQLPAIPQNFPKCGNF